jgi:ferric-dicitrate binding protein FerR (iron transport regulator)
MKSKKNLVLTIIFFVFAYAIQGLTATPIAVVIKVKGKVYVQKGGDKSKTTSPKRGFRLEDGDRVLTDKKSYAALRFVDDNSLVRIRASSTCFIRGKKEKNEITKNIQLEIGTILARITKQNRKFEVSTPTSVASVKGTEFIADHRPHVKKGTYYYGLGGTVEIKSEGGTGLLHENETGHVLTKSSPPVIRKTVKGEVPDFEEGDEDEDLFEFEFQNEEGQKQILKFKVQKIEEE